MNVLAISAHTDDIELGCGATLHRLAEGHNVKAVAFSNCGKEHLVSEMYEATKKLGVEVISIMDKEVRSFGQCRQEILSEMIALKSMVKPDIVLVPSRADIHQDHQVVTNEAIRAFKHSTIYGYELPWNNLSNHNDVFFRVSELDLDMKLSALRCYKSQHHRDYFNPDYIKSLAVTRGVQIGAEYAESFEAIRIIC